MIDQVPLVVHERVAHWIRHLRPRTAAWRVRAIETRSPADLRAAVRGSSCPVVVIDLGDRPARALEALDDALQVAPNALSLALIRQDRPGVKGLAQELGATLVLPHGTVPPVVVRLLTRWIALARQRTSAEGWSRGVEPGGPSWTAAPSACRPRSDGPTAGPDRPDRLAGFSRSSL